MNLRVAAWNLVCQALFLRDDEGRERMENVLSRSPEQVWPLVVRWADAHLVTPGVWSSLAARGIEDRLPGTAGRYLGSIYRMNRERNQRLSGQLDEVIGVLNGRGITPLLLKGAGYIRSGVYADPAARILSDLDVLVEEKQVPDAFEALKSVGYQEPDRARPPHSRHCPPLRRPDDHASVEIHWRHFKDRCDRMLPASRIWENSVDITESGRRCRVPSPTDAVTASFLNSQVMDGFGDMFIIGLRPIQDLLALDQAYGNRIDWGEIRRLMETHREERRFRQYLYSAMRATGVSSGVYPRFGLRERAHHRICLLRVRWERFESLTMRFHGLGAFLLQARYGNTDSALVLNSYRARELIHAVRRRARRLRSA